MSVQWDFLTKFILIGDSGVGKSSLLIRLTEQRWLAATDPTVGVEFGSHTITIAETGERVRANVWDTAGSEAFRSLTQSYYRGAAGALIVYSVTHRDSFLHVAEWLRDVRSLAEDNVSILLVGNMVDLVEQEGQRREVTKEEAEEFANKEGLLFLETSAKTGENVEAAFVRAAREIHGKFTAARDAGASGGGGLMKRGGRAAAAAVVAGRGDTDLRLGSSGREGDDGKTCCIVM